MTLYMIGIGLNDEEDITIKGLKKIKESDYVFLEVYTSKLQVVMKRLESFYNKKIIAADRDLVEQRADEILSKAKTKKVSFLVVGDVFGATTHTDLFLRAKEKGVEVEIINNASILNAVGVTGLELYKFGKTTSIPYKEHNFRPETAYDVLKSNQKSGLHTLILLDIKPDRNMTVNEAIKIMLEIENKRKEKVFTNNSMILGCARLGGDYKIKYGKVSELENEDFGKPLHCLIVPGKLHFMEEEALAMWKVSTKK
ncbi:MAG: diphthine synthase [Nanoarchaeota archaeon]|nr:diphthine synthase [Nanoarchaeota archaeon]MBU1854707.1 diphthine synthase [Nanoarchaeota archaeon]